MPYASGALNVGMYDFLLGPGFCHGCSLTGGGAAAAGCAGPGEGPTLADAAASCDAPEVAGLLRLCCDGALFTEVLVYVGFTASISALAPVCRSVVRFWKNSTASPPKLLHLYCFCHLFENINVRPWQRVPPNGGSWPLHLRTSSDFYRWRSFLLIQRHQ